MWFTEISLDPINHGSEPPYSVFFLLLPFFIHFLALKLSNQIPQGSLVSKGQAEMAGKRVLPKKARKGKGRGREGKREGVPRPLRVEQVCLSAALPGSFTHKASKGQGKENVYSQRSASLQETVHALLLRAS